MSWDRSRAAPALAEALRAHVPDVTVFEAPPSTFNAPALVVQYPTTVVFSTPTMAVDLATWSVLAAVGLDQAAALDGLLYSARAAVMLDPTLGRAVQTTRPVELRNWRLVGVTGTELLGADLVLETRM